MGQLNKVKGYLGRIRPRRTNFYGRKMDLYLRTMPGTGSLLVQIDNEHLTWTTGVYLDPDEAATLGRLIAQHLETVTTLEALKRRLYVETGSPEPKLPELKLG